MKRSNVAFVVFCTFLAMLCGCGSDPASPNVTPPKTYLPLAVIEGYGTEEVPLGATRAFADSVLGAPLDTTGSVYCYRKDSADYQIRYGAGAVRSMLVACNRIFAARCSVKTDTILFFPRKVAYDSTITQVQAIYGAGRSVADTLFFDSVGIGFVFDPLSQRVRAAIAYPVGLSFVTFSIASFFLSDTVDSNGNGYYRSYSINIDVDLSNPAASEPVTIKIYDRLTGTVPWQPIYTMPNPYTVTGATPLDLVTFKMNPGTKRIVDYNFEVINAVGAVVASQILAGIHEESPAEDWVP